MKLHKHPQKTDYASPSEWPSVQAQGWWLDPDPTKAAHVHIIPKFPLYGEITSYDTFEVPFTIQAHMLPGQIGLFQGEYVKSIKWDTPDGTMPVMRGDAMGLKQWTGVMTIDLTLGDDGPGGLHIFLFPVHGWAEVRFLTRTVFDNADILDVSWAGAVYSLIDPSAPEKAAAQQGNPGVHWRSSVVLYRNGSPIAGEMITEIDDYIPLLEFGLTPERNPVPWNTIINAYNYTAPADSVLVDGKFELFLDADLHNGNRGTLQNIQLPIPGTRQVFGPLVLDPAVMGTGNHKELCVWTQPLGAEAVASVVSVPVTVGEGIPIPPPPTQIKVPNVIGMLTDMARSMIVASGFAVGSASEVEGTTQIGTVVSETPAAGTMADTGSLVNIVSIKAPVVENTVEWKDVPVTFMQQFINGVAQPRFQICDMQGTPICRELTTTPGVESM